MKQRGQPRASDQQDLEQRYQRAAEQARPRGYADPLDLSREFGVRMPQALAWAKRMGEEGVIPLQQLKVYEPWDDPSVYGEYTKKPRLALEDVVTLLGHQSPVTLQQIRDAEAIATLSGTKLAPLTTDEDGHNLMWEVSEDGFKLHIHVNYEAQRRHLLGLLGSSDLSALREAQGDMALSLPCIHADFVAWARRNELLLPVSYRRARDIAAARGGRRRVVTEELRVSVCEAVQALDRAPLLRKLAARDIAAHERFTSRVFNAHTPFDPKRDPVARYRTAYGVNLRAVADLIRDVRKKQRK